MKSDMNIIPQRYDAVDKIGVLQFASSDQDSLQYISGAHAIRDGLIEVGEVNEAGNVNLLRVINNSDHLVFFTDGDILAGAKQNRVLNTSILLAARSKTTIPVSCIERGRWRSNSTKFSETEYTAPLSMRAEKTAKVRENLDAGNGHVSDQGAVWQKVGMFERSANFASPTSNLSDLFREKATEFDKVLEKFTPAAPANGFAIFFNNKIRGVDVFNRTDIYREYFPKILRSAAMEGMLWKDSPTVPPMKEAEASYRVVEFIDSLRKHPKEDYPGVGIGTECRLAFDNVVGLELLLEQFPVHLTVLCTGR